MAPMPELCPDGSAQRNPRDIVRLAAVAGRQHGAVSVAQLYASGVTKFAIARWVAAGRLHRVHPGVYALGHSSLPLFGRLWAALLYAGPDAAFSHTTAAWLWSLIDTEPQRIHLTVPGRPTSLLAVCLHHSGRLESTRHRGFPVTTVARTLRDLAATVSYSQLRRALAEADYRRLLEPIEVERVLGRGRCGSTALRKAFDRHLPDLAGTLSVLEERFLALCERARIPLPEVNAKVCGLTVDALWRGQQVVVELDGHRAHALRAANERDRERELKLRDGFVVLRYTWQQVSNQPMRVAADVRRAITTEAPTLDG